MPDKPKERPEKPMRRELEPKPTKRKRGRPETRVLKLNVSSPEEAFRRIFEAADPPDPSKRKVKNRSSVSPNDKRPPALEDLI